MKALIVLILLLTQFAANGQSYRKAFFALDFGVPMGSKAGIGSISLEPSFRINDRIAAGIRIEVRGLFAIGGNNVPLASIGTSCQYYLPVNSRIFVGSGIAIFNPSNNFIVSSTDTMNERNRLGFFPRAGVDLGHFRVMVEYNFVGNMTDYVSTFGNAGVPGGFYQSVNKNYFNLKFGFFVGGGRKK
jgi:hypothetical protein